MKMVLAALILLSGCQSQSTPQDNSAVDQLKSRISILEKRLEDTKPSLSGIMSGIQRHHTKLYYSGARLNWKLAQYELGEVKEGIQRSAMSYPEAMKNASAMDAELGNMSQLIANKNEKAFVPEFEKMTHSCNQCHATSEHDYITIEIPGPGMFTDQKFRQ